MNRHRLSIFIIVFTMVSSSVKAAGPLNPMPTVLFFHEQNISGYDILCHGGTGSAGTFIGGGGEFPYTYEWRNSSSALISSSQNIPLVVAGTYTLTIFKNGDHSSWDLTLTEPEPIEAAPDVSIYDGGFNVSQNGGSDGWIKINVTGGAGDFRFDWSNGSNWEYLEGVPAGNYSVAIFDISGCRVDTSITLTEPPPLQIDTIYSLLHNGFNLSCHGGSDGVIELVVSGGVPPYSYNWGTGVYTEDRDSLSAGTYTVIVDDANPGGEDTISITLTEPPALNVELSSPVLVNGFNTSCFSCFDGNVIPTITNGVVPYTYLWSTGATTVEADSLLRGNYSVLVTDSYGCTATNTIEVVSDIEGWKLGGNSGVDTSVQFIGTKDNKDLILKANNQKLMTLKSSGVVEMNAPLKLSPPLSSSFNSVFVNQQGILQIVDPGDLFRPCVNPIAAWVNNYCPNYNPDNIFLKTGLNNVGIGTDQPQSRLDVIGNIRSSNLSGTPGFNIVHTGADGELTSLHPPAVNASQKVLHGDGTWGASPWIFDGTNIYNNPLTAKVGIGTAIPTAALQIDHDDLNGGIVLNRISTSTTHSEIKFSNNGDQKWAIGNSLASGSSENFFIWNHTGSRNALLIDVNNNLGIDNPAPVAKLDVNGNIRAIKSGENSIVCGSNDNSKVTLFCENNQYGYGLGVDATGLGHIYRNFNNQVPVMTFTTDGAVGINFDPSSIGPARLINYKLYVEGSIAAREIKVTALNFPDYVFSPDYELLTIGKLAKYIDENNHLPGLPTAEEVLQNDGFEVGALQIKLLEKIEEQALYIISLQEQVDELKSKMNSK